MGCQKTNKKGKDLEKVVRNNNLCILNKSNTYLNPFTGSNSAVDLSLCDPVCYMNYEWKVYNDLCGSDPNPIILESLQPLHEDILPHLKINKSNCRVFDNTEIQKLNFKSNNSEKYNQPFTPAELQEAIETSHNTAVVPDEIHYQFLKHLPKNSIDYLLKIFNDIWITVNSKNHGK